MFRRLASKSLTLTYFAVLLTTFLARQNVALAQDRLGTLVLSSLLVEPSYSFSEPRRGGFGFGNSFLETTWTRDTLLSARLKFGSTALLGRPARYAATSTTEDVRVVEAFAQIDSSYGRVRAGLVPIPYGLEGGDVEERLRFPRSSFWQNRYLPLRDQGVSYHISNKGFFSDWAIHNGEAGPDLDNELWFTTRFGWVGGRTLSVGASAAAGGTAPESTGTPTGGIAPSVPGLDPDRPARVRVANLFVDWRSKPVSIALEGNLGEVRQGGNGKKTGAFRADIEFGLTEAADALIRYDLFDPLTDQSGDRVEETTLGLAYGSLYQNSVIYLLGTRRDVQGAPQPEHRVLVLWRMTPFASRPAWLL